MDNLDERLKADAESIPAEVSPELASRLKAAVEATRPIVQPQAEAPERSPLSSFTWWWMSSLSGAAAMLLIVFFVFRGADDASPGVGTAPAPIASTSEPAGAEMTPAVRIAPPVDIPLTVQTADFAEPLEEELENLKSDIEKARAKLGDDIRFSL